MKKFLEILNSKFVISIFIFIFLLGIIFAGNVVVNEGNVNIDNNLNSSGVLYVDSISELVNISGSLWVNGVNITGASGSSGGNPFNQVLNMSSNVSFYNVNSTYFNFDFKNISIGYQAGNNNIENNLIALGYRAGYNNNGSYLIAIGSADTGYNNIGSHVNVLGANAGYNNNGSHVNALGYQSGMYNIGSYINAFGYAAGLQNKGNYSTAIGYLAGNQNKGNNTIAIGYQAGYYNNGSNSIFLGTKAGKYNNYSNIFILQEASINSIPLMQGNFSSGFLGIGTALPNATLYVQGNATISSGLKIELTNSSGALPLCSAVYNRTLMANNSGIYVCGNTGSTWTKI